MRPWMIETRRHTGLAFCAAVLLAGCASSSPPPAAQPSAEAPAPEAAPSTATADSDAGERFLRALAAGDYERATAEFGDELEQALPADKLAAAWGPQVAEHGKLVSWTLVEERRQGSTELRFTRLKLERAELDAVLAIDGPTGTLAGIVFKPVAPPARTAPYANTEAFRDEAVSLGAEPFVLGGTLTLPLASTPVAAAVLVHGSGPHDRDETIGPNRPFKDLAEGLASRGVAVLRYDKRTKQHGARLGNTITLDDEVVVDAVAAVQLLQARPEVDAHRVFVLGHSLGAQLAPEIATRAKGVAGLVLLAPPARAPWDAAVAQLRYLAVPDSVLKPAEESAKQLAAGAKEGEFLGAPFSYWRDWASRDGIATAKALRKPILILHGSRDYQVTDEDVALWRKGLGAARDVSIEVITNANHLFMLGEGKPGPAEYAVPGHVDVKVIERVAAFINPTTGTGAKK